MNKKTLRLAVPALALASIPATAVAAEAATLAPSCVSRVYVKNTQTTYKVTNNCSYTVRVKVDWSSSPDSPCTLLYPNYYFTSYSFLGVYTRTIDC